MLVVYDSLTGKVKKFTQKLPEDVEVCHISQYDGSSPYYLITSTFGFGGVLKTTSEFLKDNHKNCKGVSSSGDRNWGNNFGRAANIISERYNVPYISKFEKEGLDSDVEFFINRIKELEEKFND